MNVISASSIELRTGTEGPRHDPYSYDEWTLSRGARTWKIHDGLASWVKLNDVLVESPAGGELDDALKASGCPLSLRELRKYYERIRTTPLKLHKAHGGARWAEGFPGEELLICKCGAVLDSTFDLGAII